MVKVQDITTIYVDLPERFYSFVGGAAPEAPYLKSEMISIGSLKVEVLNPDGAKSKEDVRFNYMLRLPCRKLIKSTPTVVLWQGVR